MAPESKTHKRKGTSVIYMQLILSLTGTFADLEAASMPAGEAAPKKAKKTSASTEGAKKTSTDVEGAKKRKGLNDFTLLENIV